MAKREFIETREIVYVNAPISPVLQGDSVHYEDIAFKTQIGRIDSFSEQEIVEPVLDKIRAEIEQELEQEEFARSVFRHEEKDCTKAEQCTGSIVAYRNVLKMFDKYKAESEEENDREPEKAN